MEDFNHGNNFSIITQIKQIIPHRQPFLLIDKVVEYEEGQRCVAIKQVSGNEPFFKGIFLSMR